MRQIIKLIFVLSLVIMTSCSTQQRVVYRNCNCNTTTFGFGWNNNPFWGWNDPVWGWNSWNWPPYRVIPRYYVYPNRIQPSQPTRYERRQSIGSRPSRIQQNEPQRWTSAPQNQRNSQPSRIDNTYPQRSQPSRVQTPSRVQQRTNTPITTQPTRSRVQNEPISNLKPKWYAPQQSTNGNITPMVTPQIVFQGENGRGFSGPGGFNRGY